MSKSVFDIVIETDRLKLRKLNLADVSDMYEYTSNPAVTTHLSWSAHIDERQAREFITRAIENYNALPTEFTYGIELKVEKKLIGVLKILNISFYNRRAEFTSILNPLYQGKGYMGEAWQALLGYCFNTVGLNRIQSLVTDDNIASINKNKKAGLTFEGRLKDYWMLKGHFKDALVYAITAEIYRKEHELSSNEPHFS